MATTWEHTFRFPQIPYPSAVTEEDFIVREENDKLQFPKTLVEATGRWIIAKKEDSQL